MSFLEPGPPLRVKICGLTNPVDADMALAAGADALGFNFYEKSKRHLDLEAAQHAAHKGIAFARTASMNDNPAVIASLAERVIGATA